MTTPNTTEPPPHSEPAPITWRSELCRCGESYIIGKTVRGKYVAVKAEPEKDGNLGLTRNLGSMVPAVATVPTAKRFGRTQLRLPHVCRFIATRLAELH